MIVDTSALVAILYREPEAKSFVERIRPPTSRGSASPIASSSRW